MINNDFLSNNNEYDLDSCLDELSRIQYGSTVSSNKRSSSSVVNKENDDKDKTTTTTTSIETKINNDGNDGKLWESTTPKPQLRIFNEHENDNDNKDTSSLSYNIPNIQLEMARHKHIQKLSSFLIETTSDKKKKSISQSSQHHNNNDKNKLRMPVFERWLIDSKLEEKTKQKHMMMSNEQHHHQRHSEAFKSKHKKRKLTTTTTTPTQIINYWDPVIPSLPETNDPSFFRLVGELTQYLNNSNNKKNKNNDYKIAQENHKEATKIATEFCKLSKEASNEIYSMSQRVGLYQNITSNNNKKKKKKSSGERVNLEYGQNENENDKDNRVYSLVYYRKTLKKPFVIKINQSHYTKLWSMFLHFNPTMNNNNYNNMREKQQQNQQIKQFFHMLVFSLLLRYSSLSGGQLLDHLRGGGMQGAIHTQVFQYLKKSQYSSTEAAAGGGGDSQVKYMECFASPFNAYLTNYTSVFPLFLDSYFGSMGNFFDIKDFFSLSGDDASNSNNDEVTAAAAAAAGGGNKKCCCEANPPFTPGLMEEMIQFMELHLRKAKENKNVLTFVIIVPTCHIALFEKDDYDNNKINKKKKRKDKKIKSKENRNVKHENDDDTDEEEEKEAVDVLQTYCTKSFRQMLKSPFLVQHGILKSREHGYIEGSQHLRPTRYKQSQYDTSVFVLQSIITSEQEKEWWDSGEFKEGLLSAFKSRH